ncbi:MAG: alpha-1,2-fucosyltransferase [Terracidiphilus sp.]
MDRTFLPALPIPPSARNIYLDGNFQARQYAEDAEQHLRTELRLREPPTGKNLETLEDIRAVETSVSLHVRRGDYGFWGGGPRVLSLDYYAQAMRALLERVRKPTFFVFSDDIPFTREHLPKSIEGARMVFVDNNDEANPHEDLRLMSACRHHIIANSTFSWWGAWLNPDPAKLVCAPMGWGLANPEEWNSDLIPPGWLLIDADIASS